ncbi:hypothetical protein [Kordia sp.]|uniref:hypothetical protein n=1 Tax=Kordia sp. TaxID=1965332 RepID=UPI003B597409
MSEENLPIQTNLDTIDLKLQLKQLQKEYDTVEQKVQALKNLIHSHLTDEIVEVQELTIIYKELKSAKKQQRLQQKQRGRNYVAPKGIKVISKPSKDKNVNHSKEKKRLYREAMLHVHPDNFYFTNEQVDLATNVTAKLIQIYKEGDLEMLKAYHAHIFSDMELATLSEKTAVSVVLKADKKSYLKSEIERLKTELIQLKNSSLYKVVTEYDNPYTFIDELKVYYKDRLVKLRKRTRKAFK